MTGHRITHLVRLQLLFLLVQYLFVQMDERSYGSQRAAMEVLRLVNPIQHLLHPRFVPRGIHERLDRTAQHSSPWRVHSRYRRLHHGRLLRVPEDAGEHCGFRGGIRVSRYLFIPLYM